MIGSSAGANLLDKRGGIFVRRLDQMSDDDKILIQTVARLVLTDAGGTLANQASRRLHGEARVPPLTKTRRRQSEPVSPTRPEKLERPDLVAFNGVGGFTSDGREYVITTTAEGAHTRALGERSGESMVRQRRERERGRLHVVRERSVLSA